MHAILNTSKNAESENERKREGKKKMKLAPDSDVF
jgi:hypothetical protein